MPGSCYRTCIFGLTDLSSVIADDATGFCLTAVSNTDGTFILHVLNDTGFIVDLRITIITCYTASIDIRIATGCNIYFAHSIFDNTHSICRSRCTTCSRNSTGICSYNTANVCKHCCQIAGCNFTAGLHISDTAS